MSSTYTYGNITYNSPINTGAPGQVLTATTGMSPSWGTLSVSSDLKGDQLTVKGNASFEGDGNFKGDIKVNGKSITDSLERIEERLAILRPNEELEEKWDQLRGLRKAYIELEAEIKEKEEVWKILKK